MPLDRGVIEKQLQALGESARWWSQLELRDLPKVLHDDEVIQGVARGRIARVRWVRRSWLIVVTQRRVIGLRSSQRSWRQIEVEGDSIRRVSLRIGPFRGRVLFSTSDRTYRALVPRRDAYKLSAAISRFAATGEAERPAPARIIRRVVDHVMALPAAALDPGTSRPLPPAAEDSNTQHRLDALEEEVNRLRQQVDFLEQLMRDRPSAPAIPDIRYPADSVTER